MINPRSLEDLFDAQRQLMEVLGVDTSGVDLENSLQFRDIVAGIMLEGAEAHNLLATSTKPWKKGLFAQRQDEFKEELVDVLFLLMEACILLGMEPKDIYAIYASKWERNMRR